MTTDDAPQDTATPEAEPAVEPVAPETPPEAPAETPAETPPPAPTPTPAPVPPADLAARIDAMEAELSAAREAQAAQATQMQEIRTRMRDWFLSTIAGGLASPEYAQLAPDITAAPPDTEAGQATLREWATKHASLFRGAGGGDTAPRPSGQTADDGPSWRQWIGLGRPTKGVI